MLCRKTTSSRNDLIRVIEVSIDDNKIVVFAMGKIFMNERLDYEGEI